MYLPPMIDCFDGMTVGWTVGAAPDAELVNSMLYADMETVTPNDEQPVVHSDGGAYY